jgi:cold shock CspA family protein
MALETAALLMGRFGFLAPDRGGAEHLVRLDDVVPPDHAALLEGDRVEFDLRHGHFGLEAVNLRLFLWSDG